MESSIKRPGCSLVLILLLSAGAAFGQTVVRRAPELNGGRGWLNTDKPLSLAALKGKVVLLDFWTYGCINCMHAIQDQKKLERKYANQLVVIGVHSGNFANEKELENIRRVIVRYDIEYPVVNDSDFAIWSAYEVKAWPTRVLIDPAGNVIGAVPGEGNLEPIDQAIARTVNEFRARGQLNEQPLKQTLERARVGDLPLSFPGKVLADASSDRLFIADSSHNRIVITKLDGTLSETIGDGERGMIDGPFEKARFSRPQGMALAGNILYVADTENHLIRRIDLASRTVTTIAGTGRQANDKRVDGPARSTSLNSPWDLQLIGRALYIAMAGQHQIWKLDLDTGQVVTFAGSGREGRRDGALLEATFAQPSGLATDGKILYSADSEANVIRVIDPDKGNVKTLGPVQADRDERLQHPLGIVVSGNRILIADTYNHSLRETDREGGGFKTFRGTGKAGQKDGRSPSFYEPAGLSIVNDRLFVADTNNHAIRVVDLKTKETSTLLIKGLEPPTLSNTTESADSTGPNQEEIRLAPQRLKANRAGRAIINVSLPEGNHLNPAAAQRYRMTLVSGTAIKLDPQAAARATKSLTLPLELSFATLDQGRAELRIQLTLFYCREDNTGTCNIKTLIFHAPVEVTDEQSAPSELRLQGKVEEK